MKIHVHLGVHKTATTTQQELLRRNLPKLQAHGVGYLELNALRELLTNKLSLLVPSNFRIEDHLPAFFPAGVPASPRGIIISDENLLGGCASLLTSGTLYPAVAQRLAQLRGLLAGHDVTAYLSMRGYGDFLAAAYCEAMLGTRQFMDFEVFRAKLKLRTVSWPDLLQTVLTQLAPSTLRVWCFEDYPSHAEAILSEMAFGAPGPLVLPDIAQRPSFSQAAIDFLSLVDKKLGVDAASELLGGMQKVAPRAAGYPRFDPWNSMQRTRFEQRYRAECAQVPPTYWIVTPTT